MMRFKAGWRLDIGISIRSGWEGNYARFLNWLIVHTNEVIHWEYELQRATWEGGSYLPDFWVWYADGHLEIHEVKGRNVGIVRMKKFARTYDVPVKLVCNPNARWVRKMTVNGRSIITGKGKERVEIELISYPAIATAMKGLIKEWE